MRASRIRELLPPRKRRRLIGRLGVPVSLEQSYGRDIRQVAYAFRQGVLERLFPALPGILAEAKALRGEVRDSYGDDIDKALKEALIPARKFNDIWVETRARQQFEDVSRFHRRQITQRLADSLSLNVWFEDPWYEQQLKGFVSLNAELIKNITDKAALDIRHNVTEGIRRGMRYEELAQRLVDRLELPANRALLVARDQTSKAYGEMNHLRQVELGVRTYIWRTMLDEKVRDSHAEKEGEEFSWDDPPAGTGHPGDDYECRCTADGVLPF